MEAKELMIGDLVKITKGNLVGRIEDINASRDFVAYYNIHGEERFLEAAFMKHVESIHLTEEILKANGFEYDGCFWRIWNKKYHNYNMVTFSDIDVEDVPTAFLGHWAFDENYAIDYVHELQHALRLCGLNDLAENFKIE